MSTFYTRELIGKASEVYDETTGRTVARCDIGGLDPETDGYATFFAAAPDLYAALAEMTELAAGPVDGVTVSAKRAILDKGRAALAKARGEQ